jgi:hypothetical protein
VKPRRVRFRPPDPESVQLRILRIRDIREQLENAIQWGSAGAYELGLTDELHRYLREHLAYFAIGHGLFPAGYRGKHDMRNMIYKPRKDDDGDDA